MAWSSKGNNVKSILLIYYMLMVSFQFLPYRWGWWRWWHRKTLNSPLEWMVGQPASQQCSSTTSLSAALINTPQTLEDSPPPSEVTIEERPHSLSNQLHFVRTSMMRSNSVSGHKSSVGFRISKYVPRLIMTFVCRSVQWIGDRILLNDLTRVPESSKISKTDQD